MSGSSDSAYRRASATFSSLELRLPGKIPSARIYSFVVSAINEEKVCSFNDFYPTRGKASDLRPWRCTIFPTHEQNSLKRQISNFSLKKMRNSMSVGKDIWKLLMLVLTMALIHGCCLKGWDEPQRGEVGKMKSQPNALHDKAGMYTLNEDVKMKAKFAL
ncbi:hypothetical protein AAG906_027884 [Vitis piasezkii]